LTGEKQRGEHAGQRVTGNCDRLLTRCEPIKSLWPFSSAPTAHFTRKEPHPTQKKTFYIPQIFMHISQYTFYYHFNKYKNNNTVILKENNEY
jgi:hypothetical protein